MKYLIFCFERGQYWKACACGYTTDKAEAGRYSEAEARDICLTANKFSAKIEEAMIPVTE